MQETHKCSKESEISALVTNQTVLFIATESNKKEIDNFKSEQKNMYDLVKSVAVIAEQIITIRDDVRAVKTDVLSMKSELKTELNSIKANKIAELIDELNVWQKYKTTIISIIITAVLSVYLMKIGGM